MKNVLRLIISISISIIITFSLLYINNSVALNNDKYSETFKGYISDTVYSNVENTAKGYLNNELSGATASIQYKNCRVIKQLSAQEIEILNLSDLTDKNIIGVDDVEIEFVRNDTQSSINTLFVSTNSGFMYYVAPQRTGEPLTNSYLQSVLNGNNYVNCTSNTSFNFRLIDPEMTLSTTYYHSILIDNDKIYVKQNLLGLSNEIYLVEKNNKIVAYCKDPNLNDGKFYTLSEINRRLPYNYIYQVKIIKGGNEIDVNMLSSMKEAIDLIFLFEFDASYFIKQDFGYSITNDKFKDLCKTIAGESYAEQIDKDWLDYHINFRGDYYVSDGRLSSCVIVLTVINEDKIFALNVNTEYTDFGTTVVKLPFEAEAI